MYALTNVLCDDLCALILIIIHVRKIAVSIEWKSLAERWSLQRILFLLVLFMHFCGPVNANEWICDISTKDYNCVDLKSPILCYNDTNLGYYVPCYQKCNNVEEEIYLIDCRTSCNGYLKAYCSTSSGSSELLPVSDVTLSTTTSGTESTVHPGFHTTSSAEASDNAASSSDKRLLSLLVLFLLLVPLIFWIKFTDIGGKCFKLFMKWIRNCFTRKYEAGSPRDSGYDSPETGNISANGEDVELHTLESRHTQRSQDALAESGQGAREEAVSQLVTGQELPVVINTCETRPVQESQDEQHIMRPFIQVSTVADEEFVDQGNSDTEELPEESESDSLIADRITLPMH